ncbi:MAG: translation initiation factor IF-2 N-terminal domain-containing protein [Vicinamibacterales bacterium]
MATVRIYKVAELLNMSSHDVLDLLQKNHGIELKSASSTLEEIVARQFVERHAKQRGIELPKGDMFSDQAVKAAKSRGTARKGAPAEPAKPAVPTLGPPRLVKKPVLVKPATADSPGDAEDTPAAAPAEAPEVPAASVEPVSAPEPTPDIAAAPEAPPAEPVAPPAPAPEPEAPAAPVAPAAAQGAPSPAPAEPAVDAPAAAAAPAPAAEPPPAKAPEARPAPPARPAGRFVPPSIRLRVEEPGQAPPSAPPLVPRRIVLPPPPPPRPVTRPAPPPATPRPNTPRAGYSRPGTTPAMLGGPRPLPAQPVRPGQPPMGRPAMGRPPYGNRPRPSGPRSHRRDSLQRMPAAPPPVEPPPISRTITLAEGMTVKDLADKLEVRVKEVLKALMDRRMMMTINSVVDMNTARDVARNFGAKVETRTYEEELLDEESEAIDPTDLVPRAPVVTVMGHVDHGKTTLLDSIRTTRVAEREAGGITQHIGAYLVDGVGEQRDKHIVFLDTPGHAAFTLMRARGAKVTDVVILVVAADDGVMPQTREAIDHAKAAGVPIIVAVNKIDKPGANPEVPKRQLADLGLMPEDWGGDTVFVEVSAKQKKNLESLLEMILLVTEIGEHKANPKRAALGTVLETKLDRGRGRSPPCSCRTAPCASATTSSPARSWDACAPSSTTAAARRSRPGRRRRSSSWASRPCPRRATRSRRWPTRRRRARLRPSARPRPRSARSAPRAAA